MSAARIEAVELCGCTNEALEAERTCGRRDCPNFQDHVDVIADALADLPHGDSTEFGSVEVYRQERSDPDGWEYVVGRTDLLDNWDAAALVVQLGGRADLP